MCDHIPTEVRMTLLSPRSEANKHAEPRLDNNNVRLIGVGLEELGVEEFVKLEFFKGELYIDTKNESYKALGFKRMNIFNVFPSIFGKKAREVNDQAKKDNIGGNLAGDGMQNGGTLVIDKGGKVLLCFKQENAADHVENSEILKALGLNAGVTGGQSEGAMGGAEGDGARKNVCKDDACN